MLFLILKSSACLAIFMVFYKLCLEKTSANHFKRFYLISAILLSLSIPFITFTKYIEPQIVNATIVTEFDANSIFEKKLNNIVFKDYVPYFIWSIYALGVILLSFRFLKNLYTLFQKIKTNPKFKNEKFINVLLKDLIIPYTFFNYIFLNKTNYENNLIPNEVLLHEQIHAQQKHALDILFIEILQVLFWFNPLLFLIKKDIKLNHEFLADQAVLKYGIDSSTYQKTLLTFSSNASSNNLTNAINYSLIKKRFTVMKTKTSKTILWLRSLILLPVLAILIYGFSNKNYVEIDRKVFNTVDKTSSIQQKATPKQVAEYNALAKKYNEQPQNKRIIKLKDIKRLEYLYSLMSKEQKSKAQPFPNCPPPPKQPEVIEVPAPPKATETLEVPPPPPLPKLSTNKTYSKELQKLKTQYEKKSKEYAEYVKNYRENKGEASKLKSKYQHVMKLYSSYYKLADKENIIIPPPPPPAPKSPLDHVIHMAKKGASFYYNNKKISSDRAIELLKKNKNLNITTNSNNGNIEVKIQAEPIEQ